MFISGRVWMDFHGADKQTNTISLQQRASMFMYIVNILHVVEFDRKMFLKILDFLDQIYMHMHM